MRKEKLVLASILAIFAAPALFAQSAPPFVTTVEPTLSSSSGPIGTSTDFTVTTGGAGGYGPYQTGSGGEFTLYSTDLSAAINGYYIDARGQGTAGGLLGSEPNFQTFCVEGGEYIYPNNISDVTRSAVTIYTGVTLSKGAAYLYSQFATGGNFDNVATYDYTDAGRFTSASELQNAIWALMNAQEGQTPANNPGNPFLAAAEAEFGSFDAAAVAGGADYDGVYILNLWAPGQVGTSGGAQQDQLIYWPGVNIGTNVSVPDGGSTFALLGLGFGGLMVFRRQQRRLS